MSNKIIGLSLGADICWPACYEEIVRQLGVPVDVERVSVEPFDLRQPCKYEVVIDRLTHWFHTSREWIKKSIILDHLYVLNNPWSLQSMEKQTTYCAMMKLGLPVPRTWMVPPKEHHPGEDVEPTLRRYAQFFDLGAIGEELGYPVFIKPYDGGGWVGVMRAKNAQQLRDAYEHSGTRVMHVQESIEPNDMFVRAIGIGPQVHIVHYDPSAPLHDRYKVDFFFVDGDEWSLLTDMTLTINGFFGWDFNSCEAMRREGVFHPIDFANACPDFQVTSLHFHFPSLVKNMIRWSLFCAMTERPMRQTLDWEPYYAVASKDLPYRERLAGYAAISRERFETDRFREFCETELSHLDEIALEFFQTDRAREIFREKVAALYPAHEVEPFTDHFHGLVQFWCKTEADRLNGGGS